MVYIQNIWWAPLTWLFIPLRLNLNVVLGVQEDRNGELKFTYQEDHIFWVESLLEINPIMTLGLGPVFTKYIRPVVGVILQKLFFFLHHECACLEQMLLHAHIHDFTQIQERTRLLT